MEPSPAQIGELRKEFQTKKAELARLRSKLNQAFKERNEIYQQMRAGNDKRRSLLGLVKKLKEERDQLTSEVKGLKQKRDNLNTEVKEKASVKKEAESKKKELLESVGFKGDPERIRSQIAHLEEKLETEVMPFSKEQSLRKTIKELQAVCRQLEELGTAWKEVNTVAANFSQKRKEAEESHHLVQKRADESQGKHEEINQLYEKIKQLKAEQQPLAEKLLAAKVAYDQSKKELEELSKRVKELAQILDEQEVESFKVMARRKTAEVKEKMKKGKKLSTEDILALQALKE